MITTFIAAAGFGVWNGVNRGPMWLGFVGGAAIGLVCSLLHLP